MIQLLSHGYWFSYSHCTQGILSNQAFIGLISGKIQRKPSLLSKTRWFPAGLPLKNIRMNHEIMIKRHNLQHNMPADRARAKYPGTQDFSSSQMDDVVLSGGVEVRILRREVDLCFIWTGYGIQRIGSWRFMSKIKGLDQCSNFGGTDVKPGRTPSSGPLSVHVRAMAEAVTSKEAFGRAASWPRLVGDFFSGGSELAKWWFPKIGGPQSSSIETVLKPMETPF